MTIDEDGKQNTKHFSSRRYRGAYQWIKISNRIENEALSNCGTNSKAQDFLKDDGVIQAEFQSGLEITQHQSHQGSHNAHVEIGPEHEVIGLRLGS